VPTPRLHRHALLLACAGSLLAIPAQADDLVTYRGKVTLEDGSPPGHMVIIQRTCQGEVQSTNQGAASGKTGEYFVRLHVSEFGQVGGGMDTYALLPCVLEVADKGFTSSQIDLSDRTILRNPRLPDIVLTPVTNRTVVVSSNAPVPRAASRDWDSAIKQISAHNWPGAEAPLRSVVEAAPKFAPAWAALGTLHSNLGRPQEAREALDRAIQLDPKPLPPYLSLVHALLDLQDWKAAAATTETLIARDTRHAYAEAQFLSAFALYQLQDYDNAEARINDAIRFDKLHELPRAEYVLGLILEAKRDYAGAELHMKAYIRQNPRANDLAQVHDRLKNLGSTAVADLATALKPLDLRATPTGEAPVPGGMKAFAAIARMKSVPTAENFYLEFCRAITSGGPFAVNPTKESSDEIKAFISIVGALEMLGEHRENGTLIRLTWNGEAEIRKSRAILAELGWKLVSAGDSYTLEPGDRPKDGARQWALVGFGADELTLRQAVREKREFTFEIPHETARLVGGPSWGLVQKDLPDMALGPADLFIKDWRFARVYSGLGAMDNDSATAVVGAMGLANLIAKHSISMADYAEVISVVDKHVVVPGGAGAEGAWAKLAGVSPQTPSTFLRALFEKDQGRLLAFYYDLARADAQHQQFFTATPERAEAFYKWYRDAATPAAALRVGERWQGKFVQELRLDASGQIIFPGGRSVWVDGPGSDDSILFTLAPLEAFTALSRLEAKRGARLSSSAARLLVDRFAQWRTLFPYFEKLPNLETAEFRALADFTDEASRAPAPRRNLLMGEWHSLVELIVLGAQSGGLNAVRAAQAFREACDAMRSPNPSAGAIDTVRAISGGASDIDDALAGQVLRLNGVRRDAFEEVKKLQNIPRLSSLGAQPDANRTLSALSGAVYAAVLDPAYLLVAEDPHLVAKHAFVSGSNLFTPSSLKISSDAPGTGFIGGFASFAESARDLRQRVVGVPLPDAEDAVSSDRPTPPSAGGPAPTPAGDLIFRAGGRIVEVYATVVDGRGRYVDNLTANQFSVLEEGQSKPVFAFENHNAAVSVALLFDTTGSMVDALPSLKSAALQLVNELRPNDSVAVYSFADAVTELQPFTEDKEAAKRAILKTHAQGITALYDALVRVNHDLAARPGKKVILVFTDGSDNSSMLSASTAIDRAKSRGIPIYTVAQGEALEHPHLLAELTNLSRSTGGATFQIRQLRDIDGVFEKVSQDLLHGYLVAFQPAPGDNHSWRKIEVVLSGTKGLQVRAREGFFVE
jgi:Ca-activated chloride channel family protein